MSTPSEYGIGDEPLTPFERQCLRSTVDVAALERWLIVTGGQHRRTLIANFATIVTDDDMIAVRAEGGDPLDSDDSDDFDGPMDEIEVADIADDLADFSNDPREPRKLQFLEGEWVNVVQVYPPTDPELSALWFAIEPNPRGKLTSLAVEPRGPQTILPEPLAPTSIVVPLRTKRLSSHPFELEHAETLIRIAAARDTTPAA